MAAGGGVASLSDNPKGRLLRQPLSASGRQVGHSPISVAFLDRLLAVLRLRRLIPRVLSQ